MGAAGETSCLEDMHFEKALAAYQQTATLLPNLPSAQYLVGYAAFLLRKFPEAKEHLSERCEARTSILYRTSPEVG